MSDAQGRLAAHARWFIESAVHGRTPSTQPACLERHEPWGGVFVTLRMHGRLRGCIGCLDVSHSFGACLAHAATQAALADPRFAPLSAAELRDVRVEVSVLSTPTRVADPLSLELGVHGIVIQRGHRRGLFLPQVATEHRLTKEAFLSLCCTEKAGLPAEAWREPETEVLLFTTIVDAEVE